MAQRREARTAVIQALYADEIGKEQWTRIIQTVIKPRLEDPDTFKFAERLFLKTENNQEEVDEVITKHNNNRSYDGLNNIDQQILILAIVEYQYLEQIPTKVTIKE